MRLFAVIWLIIVLLTAGYLGLRLHDGLKFQTDLMALLPREQQDKQLQQANDKVTAALSQRVVILIGDKSRDEARMATLAIQKLLGSAGIMKISTDGFDKDRLTQMAKIYYPYRFNLLTDNERELLQQSKVDEIATRALSQVYGLIGMANAQLLQNDPFLLMPAFFSSLPLPMSRLHLDEGMLSTVDNGRTWVMIAGSLNGNPYALDIQEKFTAEFNKIIAEQKVTHPNLQVLKLGAVFYAHAGAKSAMSETSLIGVISTLGTILLVLLVFRASRPLLLNLLAIAVGILVAISISLAIFGELHVGALLFGVSLIGIAVDYGLQYCSEIFAPGDTPPKTRLNHVMPGITLGMATTVIGYLTLLFAPFPGLYQIATFSAIGLVAAWLTVVLWFPRIDNSTKPRHGQNLLRLADDFSNFWHRPRWAVIIALFILSIIGTFRFHFDDDVRRMQSLEPQLVREQQTIQRLIGNSGGTQFFLVQGADEEIILQREEELAAKLKPLIGNALTGFQAPAQYVPSAKRQEENLVLVKKLYAAKIVEQSQTLNLKKAALVNDSGVLLLDNVKNLSFLSPLLLDKTTHVVMLDKVTDLSAVKNAGKDIEGVRLIDPTSDFSALLAKYRNRTLVLMALSTLFMLPLIFWRYGFIGGLWVKLPAVMAVIITPFLRALLGSGFTFFDAIALLLVLSMGVDYAIFCAETDNKRKPATIIGVVMSALTAMLSFGLLAFSQMLAVHNFGATMLVGIALSLLFAPIAQRRNHGKTIL